MSESLLNPVEALIRHIETLFYLIKALFYGDAKFLESLSDVINAL